MIEGIAEIPKLIDISAAISSSGFGVDVNFYYSAEFSEPYLLSIPMEKSILADKYSLFTPSYRVKIST